MSEEKNIPYVAHESDMYFNDKKNKRLWLTIDALVGFLAAAFMILLFRRK
jgi:hypothetical protein